MFWRFFAATDPSISRFISRDVDSRLMPRDAAAVVAWEASGLPVHVIRDHPSHSRYPMSGGLWGCVRGALPDLMQQVRPSYGENARGREGGETTFHQSCGPAQCAPPDRLPIKQSRRARARKGKLSMGLKTRCRHRFRHQCLPQHRMQPLLNTPRPPSSDRVWNLSSAPQHVPFPALLPSPRQIDSYPADSNYLTDMNFLNSIVWPRVRTRSLQHDSFSCDVFSGAKSYPVPPDEAGMHVGQVRVHSAGLGGAGVSRGCDASGPLCRPRLISAHAYTQALWQCWRGPSLSISPPTRPPPPLSHNPAPSPNPRALSPQVFDETDASRPIDVQMILSAKQPAACRPDGSGFSAAAAAGVDVPQDECARLRDLYQVQPGRSWGGLPAPLEPRWHKMECDRLSAPQGRRGRRAGGGGSRTS
jgi:hypothetical protein